MDIQRLLEFSLFLGWAFLLVFVTHRLVWSFLAIFVPDRTSYFWTVRLPVRWRQGLLSHLALLVPFLFFLFAEGYMLCFCPYDAGLKTGLMIFALLSVVARYSLRN